MIYRAITKIFSFILMILVSFVVSVHADCCRGLTEDYVGTSGILVHNASNIAGSPKNYKQVEKILINNGFKKIRQKGSHVTFSNGSRTATVPNHGGKDIPKGTLNSIAKQARIC